MAKKYRVTLTIEERGSLKAMLCKGRAAARKLAHARILLQADEADGGPAAADAGIAASLDTTTRTCERVRRRFVEQGLEAALLPKPTKRAYARKLDGAQEAKLMALACSKPPAGKKRWAVRLLAARAVELEIAESVSHELARRTLKKTRTAKPAGAARG